MKKIYILAILVLVLALALGAFKVFVSKTGMPGTLEDASYTAEDFSWEATVLPRAAGLSDQAPNTYGLTLHVDGEAYSMNDYYKEPLYGCYEAAGQTPAPERPREVKTQPGAVSDTLCYFHGGHLFSVIEKDGTYVVMHQNVGDFSEADKQPSVLFEI